MANSADLGDAQNILRCPNPDHSEHRIRKKGLRTSSKGPQQRYECLGRDGEKHTFGVDLAAAAARSRPRKLVCPKHPDGRVQSKGTRENAQGVWRRYRCIRPDKATHDFRILESPTGSVLTNLTPPPACPDHAGSKVTRHGHYGGTVKRQRYLCVSPQGRHSFTPPLPRQLVAVGVASCSTCDELLSPHRGTQSGARATGWSLPAIVRALNELSLGASYASTAVQMREHRALTIQHLREAHDLGGTVLDAAQVEAGGTYAAKEGKKAWHLAADLVEQYAPLVYAQVEAKMRRREQALRAANDEILADHPDVVLQAPLTWVLDEVPIRLKRRNPVTKRREKHMWTIHVVVEVAWQKPAVKGAQPQKRYLLRLARAYPRGNANTWRLVFQELGVRPDVIVADCADSIALGMKAAYDDTVTFIPSMYHLRKNLTERLLEQKGATVMVEGRARLRDNLAKPLDMLGREDLRNMSETDIRTWWDDYLALLVDTGIATPSAETQRARYEERMVRAVPVLTSHPHLPASNAAVENRIRVKLDPFLANRKQMYRNLARTNFLLDLAVAREQGAFLDLDRLMKLVRDDNVAAGGWAREPRTIDDPQPDSNMPGYRGPYSSLLNPVMVEALLDHRGLGAVEVVP